MSGTPSLSIFSRRAASVELDRATAAAIMTTLPLVEVWAVTPAFADRLGRIERHGMVTHLVFSACQNLDGADVAAVAARVVVPNALLDDIVRQLSGDKGSFLNSDTVTALRAVN